MNEFNYETPVGTFRTYDEAVAAVERCDFDPCAPGIIKPVRVAS